MISRRQTISRRGLLGTAMAVLGSVALGPSTARAATAPARLFVPGYRSGEATEAGGLIVDRPGVLKAPAGWDGPRTLVSILDLGAPDAPPRRAAYPVRGHGIALAPAAGVAVFAGMEGDTIAAFDPETLDLVAMAAPMRPGWRFGGHALTLPDGLHVAIAERAPAEPIGPDPMADLARMAGRVVIREAATLRPVGDFSSYGLRPHDLQTTADGRHLVIANYGSTAADHTPEGEAELPHVLAPSAAIVELASGRLVDRMAAPDLGAELRHLVAPALDRIFAVTAKVARAAPSSDPTRDPAAEVGLDYVSALPLRRAGREAVPLLTEAPKLARHGLSIAYDRTADAVLISFPASHRIGVFDGATGATRKLIRTDEAGLSFPCGIAPSPDGRHWLVTGYWGGLLRLAQGDFALSPVQAGAAWWGHSHTVAG